MPLDDAAVIGETQDFVDESAVLVAVVDHDGVDAPVDIFDDEVQLRQAATGELNYTSSWKCANTASTGIPRLDPLPAERGRIECQAADCSDTVPTVPAIFRERY